MDTAHGDPEDIEALARDILDFKDSMESDLDRLRKRLETVDWDDQHYRHYLEQFERMYGVLTLVLEGLEDEHAPRLEGDAAALTEYLQGR